jgi:uncharacterized membrane protein YczE
MRREQLHGGATTPDLAQQRCNWHWRTCIGFTRRPAFDTALRELAPAWPDAPSGQVIYGSASPPCVNPLGAGTVVNISLVRMLIDVALWALPTPGSLVVRSAFLVVGVVMCAAPSAVYLGCHLGPGPRDGLMTGLMNRTGRSLALVRTALEASVLLVGFLLGRTVGVGTVLFAPAIGPLIQFFLPRVAVSLELPTEQHARQPVLR